MGNRGSLILLLLASADLLHLDLVHADPLYTIETLGALGSGAALPTGINSSGNAMGWITDWQGNVNPVYLSNGHATAFGSNGQANAINNNGVAVGTLFGGDDPK